MTLQTIPLIGYGSDLDPTTPGVFVDCMGMEPTMRGWRLKRGLTNLGTAAATAGSYVTNAGIVPKNGDTTYVHFAAYDGTSGKQRLYGYTGAVLSDMSRAAKYTAGTKFHFCQYGVYVLATNLTDVVQVRDVTGGFNFADTGATGIPKAQLCCTWGPPTSPRVMLGNYNDGVNAYTDGWWTSHIGGPTADWTPNIATGAANGRLLGTRYLTNLIAYGDEIIAFSPSQMWVGQINPDVVVSWRKITDDIGCVGPYAAKVLNGILYFVGTQGLYQYDGTFPQRVQWPIQLEIVSKAVGNPYIQLAIDGNGWRLMIGIPNAPVTIDQALYALVVNVVTGRVGHLGVNPGYVLLLDETYKIACSATSIAAGNFIIYKENTSPAFVDVNSGLGLQLSYLGANEGYTLLRRVTPRFVTPPRIYQCTDFYGDTMDAVTSTGPITTVSGTPWHADFMHSAHWHSPQILLESNGGYDPELIDIQVDMQPDGSA